MSIPKTSITKQYEIVCLLRQDMSLAEVEASTTFVESIFEKNNTKVIKKENWGDRSLAYPIKANTTATYIFFVVETDPKSILEVEDELKRESTIIRYLIKKADFVAEEESYLAQTAEVQA